MKQELSDRIAAAFANVPYPGDENIGRYEVDGFIGQTDWTKVPLKLLIHGVVEQYMFSKEGYHFYLPAFLTTVLNNPEFDNDWSGDIVDGLTPRKEQYSRDRLERIVKLFSQEQIAVVIEFLKIYPQLQPYSAHALLDERRSELEEAIRFWQSQLL